MHIPPDGLKDLQMTHRPARQRLRAMIATSSLIGGGVAVLALATPASAAPVAKPVPGQRISTVFGTSGNNTIVISRDAAGHILVNGAAAKVGRSQATVTNVDQLRVFGLGGNEPISLNETNGPLPQAQLIGGDGNDAITGGAEADLLSGGNGNDLIEGGTGNETLLGGGRKDFIDGNSGADTAMLGDGNDTFKWDPGDGSDRVEGQAGLDTMLFNGSDAGETFNVAANGRRVTFTRDPGGIRMDLVGIEAIGTRAL